MADSWHPCCPCPESSSSSVDCDCVICGCCWPRSIPRRYAITVSGVVEADQFDPPQPGCTTQCAAVNATYILEFAEPDTTNPNPATDAWLRNFLFCEVTPDVDYGLAPAANCNWVLRGTEIQDQECEPDCTNAANVVMAILTLYDPLRADAEDPCAARPTRTEATRRKLTFQLLLGTCNQDATFAVGHQRPCTWMTWEATLYDDNCWWDCVELLPVARPSFPITGNAFDGTGVLPFNAFRDGDPNDAWPRCQHPADSSRALVCLVDGEPPTGPPLSCCGAGGLASAYKLTAHITAPDVDTGEWQVTRRTLPYTPCGGSVQEYNEPVMFVSPAFEGEIGGGGVISGTNLSQAVLVLECDGGGDILATAYIHAFCGIWGGELKAGMRDTWTATIPGGSCQFDCIEMTRVSREDATGYPPGTLPEYTLFLSTTGRSC